MSAAQTIYQIKVVLIDSKPPIWRRFLVADTTMLNQLHEILQIVMGWTNSHLHHFFINGEYYGMDMDDEFGDMRTKAESRFKLNQLVSGTGFRFGYEYDFGDSWLHDLSIEKIVPAEEDLDYLVCIAGKQACPPEDVGGVWGYQDFLKAISDPNHPEHDDLLEWIGGRFDPEYFNLEEVNIGLRHLRKSREYDDQPPQLEGRILKRMTAWSQGLKKEQQVFAESLAIGRLDSPAQIFDLTIADIDQALTDSSLNLRALAQARGAHQQDAQKQTHRPHPRLARQDFLPAP